MSFVFFRHSVSDASASLAGTVRCKSHANVETLLNWYMSCPMMKSILTPPAALLIMASVASATSFDGTYRLTSDADCTAVGMDGGALRIEDGIFYGVESQCRMTNPVNVVDMDAKLYTMQCSGEGETWTERAMLMRSASGGIIIAWNGYAFAYETCDAADIALDALRTDGE